MKKSFYYTSIIAVILFSACSAPNNSKENSNTEVTKENTEKVEANISEKKVEVAKELTTDEKIQQIKEWFTEIENSKASLKVKKLHYANPAADMYYDHSNYEAYYKGDDLVKLVEISGEEMYLFKNSFYFKNNKLFFIFNEGSYDDLAFVENRYYLSNGKVIKALTKQNPEEDGTPLSKFQNVENPDFVKDANEVTKKQQELFTTALKRYAASK